MKISGFVRQIKLIAQSGLDLLFPYDCIYCDVGREEGATFYVFRAKRASHGLNHHSVIRVGFLRK